MIQRLIQRFSKRYVYVVIANECEKVKECIVVGNLAEASQLYRRLQGIYGGANVCMASREVNRIPFLHQTV